MTHAYVCDIHVCGIGTPLVMQRESTTHETPLAHNALNHISRTGTTPYIYTHACTLAVSCPHVLAFLMLHRVSGIRAGQSGVAEISTWWLRLVGSLNSSVSFAKESYERDDILQKRPMILRSLRIVATS